MSTQKLTLFQDPSLKRCFGVDLLIKDCTWSYLSSLRTTKQPYEPLPRLVDLLQYLTSGPEAEKIWILLDIKVRKALPQTTIRVFTN